MTFLVVISDWVDALLIVREYMYRRMHEEQLEKEQRESLDQVGKQYRKKYEHLLSLFTNKNKL